MPVKKYAPRLQLECSNVGKLRLLFASTVVLSQLCLATLPLSLSLKSLLLLLITVLAWRCWSRRCELGADPVTLIWDAENRWWWSQGGEERELVLCGDSYLSTGMVILNFSAPTSRIRRSLVLFPASVGAMNFRRLTVRLRLEGRQSVKEKNGLVGLLKGRFAKKGASRDNK